MICHTNLNHVEKCNDFFNFDFFFFLNNDIIIEIWTRLEHKFCISEIMVFNLILKHNSCFDIHMK